MASATVKTEDAWGRGHGNIVYLSEVLIESSMGGGNVRIGGISTSGREVYSKFGGIDEEEMDALCKDWLTARGYTVSEPGAQTVNQELLDAGNRFERLIDDLSEYAPVGYSVSIDEALGQWAEVRSSARIVEAQTSAP